METIEERIKAAHIIADKIRSLKNANAADTVDTAIAVVVLSDRVKELEVIIGRVLVKLREMYDKDYKKEG